MERERRGINGVKTPKKEVWFETLGKTLKDERNLEEFQEALDAVPSGALRGYIQKKREGGLFDYLGAIAKKAGLHIGGRPGILFYETVRDSGLPIRKLKIGEQIKNGKSYPQVYYVVYSQHKEAIIEILKRNIENKKFIENPVQQICGPQDGNLPSSYKLKKRKGFKSAKELLEEMDMLDGSVPIGELFPPNCPVRVYTYGEAYQYPAEEKRKLRAFLEKRRQEFAQVNS